jgi:hypothetical protein
MGRRKLSIPIAVPKDMASTMGVKEHSFCLSILRLHKSTFYFSAFLTRWNIDICCMFEPERRCWPASFAFVLETSKLLGTNLWTNSTLKYLMAAN